MNILVLTEQWFPDYAGGSGRVATETALELARLGHTVTVIAPKHDGEAAQSEPRPGLKLLRIVERGKLVPQTVSDPARFRRAARKVAAQQFDLTIVHQPSGVEAARVVGAPTAFVFHASGYREAIHRRSMGVGGLAAVKSRGVEQPLRLLEHRSMDGASVVFVLSEFSRKLIATDHPRALRKVVVAGGGIDTHRFVPAADRPALRTELEIAPGEQVLLTVRRLVARTGVGVLLEAFAEIHRAAPETRLVVVGDGEDRVELEERVAELGLTESVRFCGRISDDEVLAWYQAADLFVLPTVAYEGFGMSTAESLACGTPVVGTPVGATPELLGPAEAGFLSESASSADLAEATTQALSNITPAHRLSAREYATAELSVEAMVARWIVAIEGNEVGQEA